MSHVQKLLDLHAGASEGHRISKHKVVVRTAGYKAYAALAQSIRQNCGVFHYLLLIGPEFLAHGLLEAYGLARDDVHERAALSSREHAAVYLLFQLVLAEYDSAAGAAEGLVCSAGNDVRIRHGTGVNAGGDKTAYMGHIDHEVRPDLIGYLTHLLEVDEARVRARARNDKLRLAFAGRLHGFFIVDGLRFGIDSVEAGIEVFTGD